MISFNWLFVEVMSGVLIWFVSVVIKIFVVCIVDCNFLCDIGLLFFCKVMLKSFVICDLIFWGNCCVMIIFSGDFDIWGFLIFLILEC